MTMFDSVNRLLNRGQTTSVPPAAIAQKPVFTSNATRTPLSGKTSGIAGASHLMGTPTTGPRQTSGGPFKMMDPPLVEDDEPCYLMDPPFVGDDERCYAMDPPFVGGDSARAKIISRQRKDTVDRMPIDNERKPQRVRVGRSREYLMPCLRDPCPPDSIPRCPPDEKPKPSDAVRSNDVANTSDAVQSNVVVKPSIVNPKGLDLSLEDGDRKLQNLDLTLEDGDQKIQNVELQLEDGAFKLELRYQRG